MVAVAALVAPPETTMELLQRARSLAGRSLGEVAAGAGRRAPEDLRHHKGWVGQLIERALGASAGSRDEPDFSALGVELKTLPVRADGVPAETTFVCTIELRELESAPWEASRVRRKLASVLWVPVEGERALPVAERRIGSAFLWSPSRSEEGDLRADWEELKGIIGAGEIESIDARIGKYLHVRPKAATSRVRRRAIDDEGVMSSTLPRGFYLRTAFTARLVRERLLPAAGSR